MSRSEKLQNPVDNEEIAANDSQHNDPFSPTRTRAALLIISLAVLFERLSEVKTLPFEIGMIAGTIPPECLIWTLILVEMAVKDIKQLWSDIADQGSHS